MMKLKQYILATAIILSPAMVWAQSENPNDDDEEVIVVEEEDDDEEETADESSEIEFPEALSTDLDSLLHLYNVQTYLTPDGNCDLPNVNPVYEPEVYKERLRKLPTIIELPYNDVVQKVIDKYSGNLRRSVSIMLGASNFYMPIFEQALEEYGIPLELKYLPVIESSLNPNAVSRVGATGLWQFMLATGKQYGLEVNSLVDERRDPVKASYAAAHYLSDLYKIFGDWNLVIAAYNCGPENINKAIHRSGDQRDYWKIYPYLPRETRGYVPAFIAANYIMNYYCEHNICPMRAELPVKTDTVVVNQDVHFEQIAAVLNMPVAQLQTLNPQYRRNIVNGGTKPSAIRLPQAKAIEFIDKQDSIMAYNPDAYIAKRAEVDVNDSSVASTTTTKKSKNSKRSSRGSSATVKKGDTLSAIAKRNHTTVAKLRRLNGIKGSAIKPGQKIRVK